MSHRPRKRWGQHFLHDRHAIDRLLGAIAPRADDHIVEIGPGEGVLTVPLLAAAGRVDVIEIDRDLAAGLATLPDPEGRLRIHVGDALSFDFAGLAQASRVRIVGNLPYNISTPLLFHLLAQRTAIADMHLMLQREVVDRLAAPPGTSQRGRLSVMVQAYCRVDALFRLAAGAFRPPPKVESAVVRLQPYDTPAVDQRTETPFAQVVRLAFAGRRKTLRRTLAPLLDRQAIADCGVDPGERPERLTVAAFAALANAVADTENEV